jgi:hypothetical protein
MLKKNLAALVMVLLVTASGFGQAAKNASELSGTWKLSEVGGQKVTANSKSVFGDLNLKIQVNSAELKIERIVAAGSTEPKTEVFTFYSDGRGEIHNLSLLTFTAPNSRPFSSIISTPESYSSKTSWKKEKLIIRYDAATTMATTGVTFSNVKYEWELSADGKRLIMTSSSVAESNNPANSGELFGNNFQRSKIKFIFARVN